MKTYQLTDLDIQGIYIRAGERVVRLDRYGLVLFYKYRWVITYAHYFLHRWEPANSHGRLIAFHRELLGLQYSNEIVRFENGDRLDYRLVNLITRTRYVELNHNNYVTCPETVILDPNLEKYYSDKLVSY